MAWVLRHKKGQLELLDTLKVGRKLFPDDRKMSLEHAELSVEDDQLFLSDLNSANGSFLQGKKLMPHEKVSVLPGDLVRLGETKFAVELVPEEDETSRETSPQEETQELVWAGCALLVFGGLSARVLSQPTLAHGQSLGPKLLLIVLGVIFVSVVLVALPLSALFLRVRHSWVSSGVFLILLTLGSLGAYPILTGALEDQISLNHALTAAKVDYFCHRKFNKAICIQVLAACPSCMTTIENYLNRKDEKPLPPPPDPSELKSSTN